MANFVVKADINGVEKSANVVGKPLTPVATFDDVVYYHKINVADLDTTKIYDLEGNVLESAPQDGTPYIYYFDSFVECWCAGNVKMHRDVGLSSGASSYVGFTEGAVEDINTSKLTNAYVKINEDETTATLYFNYANESISVTGPVSNEELDTAINEVKKGTFVELDFSHKSPFYVSDVLNALGIDLPSSGTVFVLARDILYYNHGSTNHTGPVAIKISSTSMYLTKLEVDSYPYVSYKMIPYTSETISRVEVVLSSFTQVYLPPVLPDSIAGKTYVLKLIDGQMQWVEETAS